MASDEPTERDVEVLTDALYRDADLGPGYMLREDCEHLARRVVASDWYAERIAEAEEKGDNEARQYFVGSGELCTCGDDYGHVGHDLADRLRRKGAAEALNKAANDAWAMGAPKDVREFLFAAAAGAATLRDDA